MIGLPQRRLRAIEAIEVANQILHAAMIGLVEQIPIQAGVMIPFAPLAKLAAHEKNFLARVVDRMSRLTDAVKRVLYRHHLAA